MKRKPTPDDPVEVTVRHLQGEILEAMTYRVPRRLAIWGGQLLLLCHDGVHRCVEVIRVHEEKAA